MPEALTTRNDAIERVLDMLRGRLESAFANGQRVRMDARDGARTPRIPERVFEKQSFAEMLTTAQSDGSFELHIYIEPKR